MSNNFHLQLYRGTTSQNNAYTGLAGEITADTQAGNIRLHDGSKAGGYVVSSMPVGSIIPFAGTTIPDGYLLCDGSAISRTTYSSLFSVIGTTYGAGDGNSTFNLPDLSYRVPLWPAGQHNIGETNTGSLPNITGGYNNVIGNSNMSLPNGCFDTISYGETYFSANGTSTSFNCRTKTININASLCSSAYSRSDDNVLPRSIYMYYVIKYNV